MVSALFNHEKAALEGGGDEFEHMTQMADVNV